MPSAALPCTAQLEALVLQRDVWLAMQSHTFALRSREASSSCRRRIAAALLRFLLPLLRCDGLSLRLPPECSNQMLLPSAPRETGSSQIAAATRRVVFGRSRPQRVVTLMHGCQAMWTRFLLTSRHPALPCRPPTSSRGLRGPPLRPQPPARAPPSCAEAARRASSAAACDGRDGCSEEILLSMR